MRRDLLALQWRGRAARSQILDCAEFVRARRHAGICNDLKPQRTLEARALARWFTLARAIASSIIRSCSAGLRHRAWISGASVSIGSKYRKYPGLTDGAQNTEMPVSRS